LVLEIYANGDSCEGKIISSDNPTATPGMLIIRNLKKEGAIWKGEFYIPRFGKWLDAEFKPLNSEMKVTVHVGWFSRSRVWVKV
jgi:Uncharacterized protein conserved in bacteria (DUF2147).